MNIPDFINGSFELLAGFFIFKHCLCVLKDKQVKGVSLLAVLFFTLWGFWNLFYYPHLDQMLSFYGGIFVVIANSIWLYLLVKYKK